MHFADDGIARDAIGEFGRDLACTQTLVPKLPEQFYPFIGPGHRLPRIKTSTRDAPQRSQIALHAGAPKQINLT